MNSMKRIYLLLAVAFSGIAGVLDAQSVSVSVIDSFHPSTVRNVYEIIRHTPLSEKKQFEIARQIEHEDEYFAKMIKNELVLSNKSNNILQKMRKETLTKILSEEELDQYYRGISSSEAESQAAKVRDAMIIEMGAGYQEGKFIFASFYKIFLESMVAELKYADKPEKLKQVLLKIKEDEMNILYEKCGIVIDDNFHGTRAWKFRPNTPIR